MFFFALIFKCAIQSQSPLAALQWISHWHIPPCPSILADIACLQPTIIFIAAGYFAFAGLFLGSAHSIWVRTDEIQGLQGCCRYGLLLYFNGNRSHSYLRSP